MTTLSRAGVLAAAASAAMIGLCLTGCGGSSPSQPATLFGCASVRAPLALAVGARANVPSPALSQVSPLITGAANAQKEISLIRIDGSPQVVFDQPFSTNAGNSGSRQSDLNNYLQGLESVFVGAIHAKVPGVDDLTALTKAAQSTGPGGNVVLIDSGLQTAAPLDFRTDHLLNANPADVVNLLRKQHLLPDLRGRHVMLVGFGKTAPPQQPLDLPQQQNVANIWRQIASAAGAACVEVDSHPDDSPALTGVPPVAVVPIPRPPDIRPCGTTILNAANHVNFIENTATFIDPAGAHATLRQLAGTLRNGPQRVVLTGTTATWGPPAYRKTLSAQRASAVKEVLVNLGITSGRIRTKGVGTNWPGHVTDIGQGGALLPGPAEENREVVAQLICPGR